MDGMPGPRRPSGETVPLDREELARLAKKTVQPPPGERPNANVVRSKRSTNNVPSAPLGPTPEGEEEVVVVVEMDDDDDAPQPPRRARTATLPDPATMSILAEIARGEPAPAVKPTSDEPANRHVKRRG